MSSNPVTQAIELVGLQPLAKAVGVSYQAIRKFEKLGPSAERVLAISKATQWRIRPHDIRPDLYPNPCDGLPAYAWFVKQIELARGFLAEDEARLAEFPDDVGLRLVVRNRRQQIKDMTSALGSIEKLGAGETAREPERQAA